jgi:hypothetical protein
LQLPSDRSGYADELAAAVEELLDEGLVTIGEVTDAGFVPWSGSAAELAERARAARLAVTGDLYPGDVCWFANTPIGDARARVLLDRDEP